ncbi:Predicted arabinose efflux permease, MFS family [Laceyella tengchongensis]|uniref:Predicted arabinose efflux permease, MFS family n=2 Tax=Laceyella tengchongensis TaxID=574699 RepID=A0AA45WJ48_9BACL|nr:Predicted arabinose efflux permease, MFS family [Laceyella tengchongensis]
MIFVMIETKSYPSRADRYLQKHLHPLVIFLLFGTALIRVAAFMSLPFLAFYLTSTFHFNSFQTGVVIGMSGLGGAIGGIIGGGLSDLFGRRRILNLTMIGWTSIFFMYLFASEYVHFIVLSFLHGLFRSFFDPISQACMSDLTSEEKRLQVFSYRYVALNVGMVTGPMLGAYLFHWLGIQTFAVAGAIFALYSVMLRSRLSRYRHRLNKPPTKRRAHLVNCLRVITRDRALGYYILGGMLFFMVYAQMESNLPIYLSNEIPDGSKIYPILLVINAGLVILVQRLISKWAEKKHPLSSIVLGSCLYTLGFYCFSVNENPLMFIVGMSLLTFGEMFIFPVTNQLTDQLADEKYRGAYYGAANFAQLGLCVGPILGGWLLKRFDGLTMWNITAVISILILWFYAMGYRKYTFRRQVAVVDIVYRVLLDLKLVFVVKVVLKLIPFAVFSGIIWHLLQKSP